MAERSFRHASLMVVLSSDYKDRVFGADQCGIKASSTPKEECELSLDKQTPNSVKETYPGIGALVHGMEDEFPEVRLSSVLSIGAIARAHPALKDMCVRVALEGLHDRSKSVRLACIKVALESKPRPLRSCDIRSLLETIANDNSQEVKDAVSHFFLVGPTFSETSIAFACAEWLAKLFQDGQHAEFLFHFGQAHADCLYLSTQALEAKLYHESYSTAYQEAILTLLKGVSFKWEELPFLRLETTRRVHAFVLPEKPAVESNSFSIQVTRISVPPPAAAEDVYIMRYLVSVSGWLAANSSRSSDSSSEVVLGVEGHSCKFRLEVKERSSSGQILFESLPVALWSTVSEPRFYVVTS